MCSNLWLAEARATSRSPRAICARDCGAGTGRQRPHGTAKGAEPRLGLPVAVDQADVVIPPVPRAGPTRRVLPAVVDDPPQSERATPAHQAGEGVADQSRLPYGADREAAPRTSGRPAQLRDPDPGAAVAEAVHHSPH